MNSPRSWLSVEVSFRESAAAHRGALRHASRLSLKDRGAWGDRGMEVPRFPVPPIGRSISLDVAETEAEPTSWVRRRAPQQQQQHQSRQLDEALARRRARSASWLVARKPSLTGQLSSRRRIRPVEAAIRAGRRHLAAELTLAVTPGRSEERRLKQAKELRDEEERLKRKEKELLRADSRGFDRIREDRTQKRIKQNHIEEADVICYATAEVNDEKQLHGKPMIRARISSELSPRRGSNEDEQRNSATGRRKAVAKQKSTAMQTPNRVLYRLRVFPTLKGIGYTDKPTGRRKASFIVRFFRFLGRLALCQFGLAWLLILWAVLGAGAFYLTEGPRERAQVVALKSMQRDLAVGLATELRQLRADDRETELLWSSKVRQYVARHEKLLLMAVSSGYGEGGGSSGQLWTFPGCVLFAISVLTTLGFGAPVPRTNAGRTVTVLFGSIGIPAHFLLVLNIGLMLAMRLKKYGIVRKYREECQSDPLVFDYLPMPMWVKVTPFLGIGAYYTLGIIGFGFARLRPISDSLLFPLDFTAAGGLASIAGHVRVLYGVYLEGAVTLAAFAVAVLKVSATQSLTNIGLKYGLLIPA